MNSINDPDLSFNKPHNSPATSMQTNKFYVLFLVIENSSKKVKPIFKDYDISTQLEPVDTSKNAQVHPRDKLQESRQSNVVYEICCNPYVACHVAYIGETSHNCDIVLGNTVDPVTLEVIQQSPNIFSSGHQNDINDATILDTEETNKNVVY